MLDTLLEHQVSPRKLGLLHFDSTNDGKIISNSWVCKKNHQVSCFYKKQLSGIFVRILDSKQFDRLRGKIGICAQKKLE